MNRSFFYKSLTKKLQLSPKPKLARLIINYRGVRLNPPPLSLDFFGLDQLGVFRTSELIFDLIQYDENQTLNYCQRKTETFKLSWACQL